MFVGLSLRTNMRVQALDTLTNPNGPLFTRGDTREFKTRTYLIDSDTSTLYVRDHLKPSIII